MQYRTKQKNFLLGLFLNILLVVGMTIFLIFLTWNDSIKILIFLILLIYLTFSSLLINSYIVFYQKKYQFYMLRSSQLDPLNATENLLSKSFSSRLSSEGFTQATSHGDFFIQYRYQNDKRNRYHRYGSLEVVVIVINPKLAFDDQKIIQQINLIEDDLVKKRDFIQRYYIYTIKETTNLTEEQISEANMVQFDSIKKRHVTAINIYYNEKSSNAYFLHSKSYSPNAYYEYAVTNIKHWLN